MSHIFKFIGGIMLGAALGAGIYVVLTKEDEISIIGEIKTFANNIMQEGKRAAEERRMELEIELGQKPA